MNYQNILNNYGYLLYDLPYGQIIFMAFFIQLLTTNTGIQFSYISLLNILGYFCVGALKNHFKTTRPIKCINDTYDICPKTYDIPSGHSFYAVFWLLLIYKTLDIPYYKNLKKALIVYLAFIPLSRYLSGVHSISAVIFGSLMGLVWFIFSTLFINK